MFEHCSINIFSHSHIPLHLTSCATRTSLQTGAPAEDTYWPVSNGVLDLATCIRYHSPPLPHHQAWEPPRLVLKRQPSLLQNATQRKQFSEHKIATAPSCCYYLICLLNYFALFPVPLIIVHTHTSIRLKVFRCPKCFTVWRSGGRRHPGCARRRGGGPAGAKAAPTHAPASAPPIHK
jgi:hypothetical protein